MAPLKRHRPARSRSMKARGQKPNIAELVYKFLLADEAVEERLRSPGTKCHSCGIQEHNEVPDSRGSSGRSMGYKLEKDPTPKPQGVKRQRTSRDPAPSSCLHKHRGGEQLRKMKRYIKKALEFGVESGYLIPSESCKILRVSSDLMSSDVQRHRVCDEECFETDQSPGKFDDVQEARRRRRRRRRGRRRSRSGSRRRRSRSRGRRGRSRSQTLEEVAEENDKYNLKNNGEKRSVRADEAEREAKNAKSNASEAEKTKMMKDEDDASDMSMDDDESDEENDKKRTEVTKS